MESECKTDLQECCENLWPKTFWAEPGARPHTDYIQDMNSTSMAGAKADPPKMGQGSALTPHPKFCGTFGVLQGVLRNGLHSRKPSEEPSHRTPSFCRTFGAKPSFLKEKLKGDNCRAKSSEHFAPFLHFSRHFHIVDFSEFFLRAFSSNLKGL